MKARQSLIYLVCFLLLTACGRASPPAGSPTAGIVFVSERDGNEEIYRMDSDGSNVLRLTNHPAVDSEPAWSPDGTQIAFRSRRDGSSDIFIMDPAGNRITNLLNDPRNSLDDEFNPRWNPAGDQLAIYTDRPPGPLCGVHALAVMPLNGGTAGIRLSGDSSESFTWTPDSRVLYSSDCGGGRMRFRVWEPAGTTLRDFSPAVDLPFVAFPAFSPDGAFLAFQGTVEGNADIYLLELQTETLTRLTDHPGKDTHPTWSPDGTQIAFTTDRDGNEEIYLMNRDGSGLRNLTNHPARDAWPHWSPVNAD